jgi:hypothetical protein
LANDATKGALSGQADVTQEACPEVSESIRSPRPGRPKSYLPCVGHHQKYESDTKSSVCYIVVTALTERFCQNAMGPTRPPGPFVHPITPASGARKRRQCHMCAGAAAALPSPHAVRTASTMRNEHSGKYTPRPPLCPSCAQTMRLARTTSRFGNLPDLYTFECRACGVSHIDAA